MSGDHEVASIKATPRWRACLAHAHRWSGTLLSGYLIALLTGTHLPNPEGFFPIEGNDKWLHFCAYFGLAFLLATWRSRSTKVCWKITFAVWLTTAFFGATDELTQQLPGIHRHCDFADWVADVSGSVSGLLVWHLLRWTLFVERRGVKLQDDAIQE